MAVGTVRDAFNELTNTRYKDLIPQSENELDAIAEFERSFEMAIYQNALRLIYKDV